MKIQPVSFTSQILAQHKNVKRPILDTTTTGYITTGCLLGTAITGMAKGKIARKEHNIFAAFTLLSAALHIGLVEYNKRKYYASKNNL